MHEHLRRSISAERFHLISSRLDAKLESAVLISRRNACIYHYTAKKSTEFPTKSKHHGCQRIIINLDQPQRNVHYVILKYCSILSNTTFYGRNEYIRFRNVECVFIGQVDIYGAEVLKNFLVVFTSVEINYKLRNFYFRKMKNTRSGDFKWWQNLCCY